MNRISASSQDEFRDDQATAERAAAAIRIITDALDALGKTESVSRTPNASARVFPLAYGWFAAIVRNGQLIALAHENGLRHECAASARLVLQHTLALQWLIEGGDPAVNAVEADGHRRAFDLVRELNDTGWPLPDGFTLQPGASPAQSGALEEQFGNFKAMCALYAGGDQQYVPFRVQSGNAHPSYIGAMAYIVPETGELSTTAAGRLVLPGLDGSVLSGSREGWQRGAYGLRMKFLISVSRCLGADGRGLTSLCQQAPGLRAS